MTWQPIETAPRDGTEILAIGDNYANAANGHHYAVVAWAVDQDDGEGWFLNEDIAEDEDLLHPDNAYDWLTHWLPLPAPPYGGPMMEVTVDLYYLDRCGDVNTTTISASREDTIDSIVDHARKNFGPDILSMSVDVNFGDFPAPPEIPPCDVRRR